MTSNLLLALRTTVSLFGLLLLPGLAASLVLFPKRNTLDGYERVAVGIGLSIALLILIGYTLNLTSWGVRAGSVLTAIGAVVIGGLAYYVICYRHSFGEVLAEVRRTMSPRTILASGLVLGVVFGLSWLATDPPGAEPTTEFFLVDHEIQDRHLMLTVSIISHEPSQTTYTLQIRAGNELFDTFPSVLLGPGEEWETTLTIEPPDTRSNEPLRLAMLLLRDGNKEPYRSLHLWLENGILR